MLQCKLFYRLSNNIEVYEEAVPQTKNIPNVQLNSRPVRWIELCTKVCNVMFFQLHFFIYDSIVIVTATWIVKAHLHSEAATAAKLFLVWKLSDIHRTHAITSNDHPFGCPIICTDIYSQYYFIYWHLWQCLIRSSSLANWEAPFVNNP